MTAAGQEALDSSDRDEPWPVKGLTTGNGNARDARRCLMSGKMPDVRHRVSLMSDIVSACQHDVGFRCRAAADSELMCHIVSRFRMTLLYSGAAPPTTQ